LEHARPDGQGRRSSPRRPRRSTGRPPKPKLRAKAPKRKVYGPPAPKPSRARRAKPTAAERNVAKSRADHPAQNQHPHVAGERGTPASPDTSVAAVEKFKRSTKYGEALAAAKVSKDVQDRLREARSAPDYQPKVLGVPSWRKTKATDLIDAPSKRGTRPIDTHSILDTEGKSLGELVALRDTLKGDRKDVTKRLDKYVRDENVRKETVKKAGTATGAAGLKILDATMRGNYATAGAASAIARGKSPVKVAEAAVKGARGKEKKTFDTVLTETGWKPKGALGKAAKGTAAFTADVALDPTTYVTFGTGSVAAKTSAKAGAKASREAAEKASKAALAAGASREEAQRLAQVAAKKRGEAAAKQAAERAPKGKGITVKFAGKELPGVRRATAAYTRADRAVTHKVVPARVRAQSGKLRTGLRKTVRPMNRPVGVTEHEWGPARQAERRSRSSVSHEDARAQTLAREIQRHVPAEHYEAVIEALERNQLRKLPAEVRADPKAFDTVVNIRSAYREALRNSRRAGGVQGKVGSVREWLDKAATAKLDQTISAEQAGQKRGVVSATRRERKADAKLAVAAESARGTAGREAAVATERVRGRARQQVAVDRAQGRTSDLAEHFALTEAEAKAVRDAPTRARKVLARMTATENKAEREQALGIGRVMPGAPEGKRLENAAASHGAHVENLEAARGRATAADTIPRRSLNESHTEYLQRLRDYADTHKLPLVKARAEKLIKAQPKDTARGYYPRDYDDRILKQLGLDPAKVEGTAYARTGTGMKTARITPGLKRANQQRLSAVNPAREAAGQTPFSTNVPLTSLNYLKQMSRQTVKGELAKDLAGRGETVKVRRDGDGKIVQPALPEGTALYNLGFNKEKKFGLHPVDGIPNKPSGQYVALNPKLIDEVQGEPSHVVPALPGEKTYDKVSSFWRKRAIASFSYHIRNAVSDINTAYLEVAGHKLPGKTVSGVKATAAASKQSKQWRPVASDMTLKVNGKPMPMDEFLKTARKEGVLDAGYFGSEVASMAGEQADRASKVARTGGTAGRAVKRWNLNRENTMRLVTFKAGLDRGLSPADAADAANKFHIDYGDLTDFERRALRRLTGFYTWTARSIPLHAETLVTRPGKYATVEKLRQNVGNATTGQTEQERQEGMTDAVLKSYPFVIGKRAVSVGSPQTLLNLLPSDVSKEGMKAWQEEMSKFAWGNLNPILRNVIEGHTGQNVVTRAEIENKERPLVAAPAWVQYLPDDLKKSGMLNVTPPKGKGSAGFTDPKTGQATWGWNGKADWKYDQLMLGFMGQLAALANSGRSPATKEQAIGSILGAKIDPLNATMKERAGAQANRGTLEKLKRARGILNQQGVNAENPTAEWKRLSAAINKLEPKKPSKARKKKGGFGSGGGGGASGFGRGGASSASGFGSGGLK
jgi:hypothetical protein